MRAGFEYFGIIPLNPTSTRWIQTVPFVEALATQWEDSSMTTAVILPPCLKVCLDFEVTFFSSRIVSQILTVPSSDPVAKKS
jgi:hypothetical protein